MPRIADHILAFVRKEAQSVPPVSRRRRRAAGLLSMSFGWATVLTIAGAVAWQQTLPAKAAETPPSPRRCCTERASRRCTEARSGHASCRSAEARPCGAPGQSARGRASGCRTGQARSQQRNSGRAAGDGEAGAARPGSGSRRGAAAAESKLRFSFRFQKWTDVLDWFAQQSDLSLVMDNPPPGTFNYTDDREYSVSEALDLLNSVLLTKGYTLVRRNRMLLVLNTADGIPPDVVPRVTLEELDKRGNFELVNVIFPLGKKRRGGGQVRDQSSGESVGQRGGAAPDQASDRHGTGRHDAGHLGHHPGHPGTSAARAETEAAGAREAAAYRLSDQERRSGQGAGSPDKAVCGRYRSWPTPRPIRSAPSQRPASTLASRR